MILPPLVFPGFTQRNSESHERRRRVLGLDVVDDGSEVVRLGGAVGPGRLEGVTTSATVVENDAASPEPDPASVARSCMFRSFRSPSLFLSS